MTFLKKTDANSTLLSKHDRKYLYDFHKVLRHLLGLLLAQCRHWSVNISGCHDLRPASVSKDLEEIPSPILPDQV